TMMAQAPMLPTSAPPLVPPAGGNSELKTMMAQAPVLPHSPSGGGNEAKTVMAQAPILPSAPPPGGRPQPQPAPQNANMRTVAVGAPAPVVSQQPQQAQGTMMLPDSQGVVAYNQERAKQARAELGDRGPAPAG